MRAAFPALPALLAIGMIAACGTGDVDAPLPTPTGEAVSACDALGEQWPSVILDQPSRRTSPTSAYTAAWGDPAIVATCGVPTPPERLADAQLFEVDGVTWFAQELTNGTRFTSEGRAANLRVDVPIDYRPEAEALIDLAPAILDTVPETAPSATVAPTG